MSSSGSGKYIQISETLKSEIENGRYKDGETIPTIRSLATRFSCSPQTVNKATSRLAQLGYLESRQGSGSVVSSKKPVARDSRPMLIDKARSHHLGTSGDPENFHCRDIYLAYLMKSAEAGRSGEFIVFDKENPGISDDFLRALEVSSGFLVQGSLPGPWEHLLAENNIPTVFINRPLPEEKKGRFGAVNIDESSLNDLANYFASLGHRKILFAFSEELERTIILELREKSFRSALEKAFGSKKFELETFLFSPEDSNISIRIQSLRDSGFHAIFAYNDITALRLISLIRSAGFSVPEDFSIAGFDDLFPATMSSPPLTTVSVDRSDLVTRSLDLLNRLIEEKEPAQISETLPTRLQIRQSCYLCPPSR